jgi:hypothetical protein
VAEDEEGVWDLVTPRAVEWKTKINSQMATTFFILTLYFVVWCVTLIHC